MGLNKFRPHIRVLSEDDANSNIWNGFTKELRQGAPIQVLPVAGGWLKVLADFRDDQAPLMDTFPERLMLLLIDFDEDDDRLEKAREYVPVHLQERVFILGAWTEPERLRETLGSYETIGRSIATGCRDGNDSIWNHDLLRHNAGEMARLRLRVMPILF